MADQSTADLGREEFLDHVRLMTEYWDGQLDGGPPTTHSARERLEGLTHSILTAIDQRGYLLIPEDSPLVTEELRNAAISGTLNDDLFGGGIWRPAQGRE